MSGVRDLLFSSALGFSGKQTAQPGGVASCGPICDDLHTDGRGILRDPALSTAQGSARPLAEVRIETLSTRGGRPPGVHEVGVHVRYGEFFTFLGPPKSGKSDVLRAIAGFLPMTSGRVLVDGQDISLLPPRGRGVGYVFQEGALWPHLTVAHHIAFGLE